MIFYIYSDTQDVVNDLLMYIYIYKHVSFPICYSVEWFGVGALVMTFLDTVVFRGGVRLAKFYGVDTFCQDDIA